MKNTFPTMDDLMEMWLKAHHKGQSAIIFSSPLHVSDSSFAERVKAMKKVFGEEEFVRLVGAEFAVFVCSSHEEAVRLLRETPKDNPYALIWDGFKITSHH